jgi:peptide/nickel transport system substrate-binding protein
MSALTHRAGLAAPLATLLPARLAAQDTRPVVVGQPFLADSLDPTRGNAGWALQSHGVAEALFTTDRSGATVPNLAQAARREADGDWTVTLRRDLRFSEGVPYDAEAGSGSLRRALDENPRARTGLGAASRIEVLDATTLRIAPERMAGTIAPLLAEFPLVIHRRTEAGGFVFTGPWVVREFRHGDRLALDPNPAFREGAVRPAAVIRRLTDQNTLAIGLEAGKLELAFGLAAESLPRLRTRPGITIASTPVAYQYMLLLNLRRPALADERVRKALSLALDRAQLARAIGAGVPASGLFPASPWLMPGSPSLASVPMPAGPTGVRWCGNIEPMPWPPPGCRWRRCWG